MPAAGGLVAPGNLAAGMVDQFTVLGEATGISRGIVIPPVGGVARGAGEGGGATAGVTASAAPAAAAVLMSLLCLLCW